MAITLSAMTRAKSGDEFKVRATATFDSSYATGGEQFTAAALGLAYITEVAVSKSLGYTYDAVIATGGATCKLLAYWDDGNAASDGALVQVTSATDMSAVAPTITVYGK